VPLQEDAAVVALVIVCVAMHRVRAMVGRVTDVGGFETHRRLFHHPRAGRLEFEDPTALVPAGEPDLRIVVHLAVPGDDSAQRLAASVCLTRATRIGSRRTA